VTGQATQSIAARRLSIHTDEGYQAARRARVLGCAIDRVDMDSAVALCEEVVRSGRFLQHVSINAAKLVALQSDDELRKTVDACELVTADGQAVVWASRLLGEPLPCRVAGIDLMQRLFASAERNGSSIYVLGARAAVLEEAIRRICVAHPRLRIAGYRDGYFDESDDGRVAQEIARRAPDMLFVAMSSPRKERFLGCYGRSLNASVVMGVGGAIDVVAGVTKRAPRWMQRAGLEWLARLLQEPGRLWRRYATTNTRLVLLVGSALLGRFVQQAEGKP
jgi:N-acetylglucosaminyldiphosphoundecaprenol N-acetyl-beta-D-mannosaminyltransferase